MESGWAGRSPLWPEIHLPFSFSEAQDGPQTFRVIKADSQTPEELGPREACEFSFLLSAQTH